MTKPQHFHEFFKQFFSWNQSCQQLKSPKPQHFHEFFTPKNRQFSREIKVEFGQKMKISNSVYCVQLHGALKCQLLTIFLIRASSNNYGIRKQLTTTTKLPEMMAALSSDAVVLGSTLPSLCPKHPKIESHGVWKSIKKVPLWTNASYHLLFSSTYRVSQQVLDEKF